MRVSAVVTIAATFLSMLATPAAAVSLVPDDTFSKNGIARLVNLKGGEIRDVEVAGNHTYAAGTFRSSTGPRIFVAKFRGDGTLSRGYGAGGVATPRADVIRGATALVVNSDGSVFVMGHQKREVTFVALTPDGNPRRSFSGNGVKYVKVGPIHYLSGIHLVRDFEGRLVATATVRTEPGGWDADAKIIRMTDYGIRDDQFSRNGMRTIDRAQVDWVRSLTTDVGSRILIGFAMETPEASHATVVRVTPGGFYDKSFSGNGVQRVSISDSDLSYVRAIDARQPGGAITVAVVHLGDVFGSVRLNFDGSLDSDYGVAGKATAECGECLIGAGDAAAGKVAMLGTTNNNRALTIRINASGAVTKSDPWNLPRSFDSWMGAVEIDGAKTLIAGQLDRRPFLARLT